MAPHPRTDLAFSIMSLHEQTRGCHAYLQRARTAREVVHGSSLLAHVLRNCTVAPVLPFDDAAAMVFAALVAQRLRVRTMDLRIAAVALARGLVVLTRNASDFGRVPGLEIEDWTV
jgi:tRNA(fMet)-specific endonuclease VapC